MVKAKKVKTSTPSTEVVVIPANLNREDKIRMIWEHFKAQEVEEARQRKADASRCKGLPPTAKRGKVRSFLAAKAGMSASGYWNCDRVVQFADELKRGGRSEEAAQLLCLLNEKSVKQAMDEIKRIKGDKPTDQE